MAFPAGSYPAQVVADGAVAYWRLGETSGTTANDSIGSAHGTIGAGITLNQPGALAEGTPAMQGNASGTAVVTCPVVTLGSVFSIEFWIKQRVDPAANSRICGVFGAPNVSFQSASGSPRQLNFFPMGANLAAVGALSLGVWTYIVGTVDGAQGRLYVNGVLANGPTATTGTPAPAVFTFLGGQSVNFDGWMDEVAIYPTALTPAQIAAHYAARTFALVPPIPWAVVGGMAWSDHMDSYNVWTQITPSNAVDLGEVTDGILVGGAGDSAAVMQNGAVVTLKNMPGGAWVPIAARRINATGTTATDLVALYQQTRRPFVGAH